MKVEYVDHMGSDLSVVNAARVSFAKHKSEFDSSDSKLIDFLARNNHITPFFHTAITLRMQAPVPIRTQCFKSKVGFSENEESRRYITSNPEFFFPKFFRKAAANVKQGSSDEPLDDNDEWIDRYTVACHNSLLDYKEALSAGMCPEQARFFLPQGTEVNWIWTGSISAFARFYKLRSEATAQKEIQDLAAEVGKVIEPLFPVSWKALTC